MSKKNPYKKKRKKTRYKTGIISCTKCQTPIKYRSDWERIVALYLNTDPLVLSFEYETLKIPYVFNIKSRKIRNYYPDFIVHYTNGKKVIIEVKRNSALNQVLVLRKASAAREWAKRNGMSYVFWTENIVKALKKLLNE